MKYSIVIWALLLTSCKSNFYNLKYYPFYHEVSYFEYDPGPVISQKVHFNIKRCIDEENTTFLLIRFLKPIDSCINNTIYIEQDTQIIDYRYGTRSIWNCLGEDWDCGKRSLKGNFEILKVNNTQIKLRMDLYDPGNNIKIKGKKKIKMLDGK